MKLFWRDINNHKYLLGNLYKKDEYYYFDINVETLDNALKNGCFGIGTINILKKHHKSKTLFDFFKNRIPSQDNSNIKEFLNEIGLQEYDEYEILKRTKGYLITDRYFLE